MILGNPITLGGGGSGGATHFSLLTTQYHFSGAVIELTNSANFITDISSAFTISGDNLICNKGGDFLVKSFIFLPSNLSVNSNSLSVMNASDDTSLVYHYAAVSTSENKLSTYEKTITLTAGQEIYFRSVLGGSASSRKALGLILIMEVTA